MASAEPFGGRCGGLRLGEFIWPFTSAPSTRAEPLPAEVLELLERPLNFCLRLYSE